MKKVNNPPNPYETTERTLLEPPGDSRLDVYEDSSRAILTENDSPDVGFRWSVNCYKGCFHSCAYCYARRYHEYLGFGAGTDFESKIAVKRKAPQLLRAEFIRKSWKGELVVFSGATDCYQPLEAVYKLTQGCLQICLEFRNPASLITKSFLITRDLDLLSQLHKEASCSVTISIPFASDEMAHKIEPQASLVSRRFKALELLAKAGLPVGVSLAPTIPGLNDSDIPVILKKAKDLGASYAFHTLVRLSGSVAQVFEDRIREKLPKERAEKVLHRIQETRGGRMNDSRFGHRMHGQGTYWKSIEDLFRVSRDKFGLNDFPAPPNPSTFRRPTGQLELTL